MRKDHFHSIQNPPDKKLICLMLRHANLQTLSKWISKVTFVFDVHLIFLRQCNFILLFLYNKCHLLSSFSTYLKTVSSMIRFGMGWGFGSFSVLKQCVAKSALLQLLSWVMGNSFFNPYNFLCGVLGHIPSRSSVWPSGQWHWEWPQLP